VRTYPYLANPKRLKDFFNTIQNAGVPPKVTNRFLESVGFKSKNDRGLLTIARALGFVDSAGVPTDTWRRFRSRDAAKAVMAGALRATYTELFATYPDACRRDNEALRNFFSSHTSVGEGALRFMVGTFRALCELADFDAEVPADDGDDDSETFQPKPAVTPVRRGAVPPASPAGITMNINIQLAIPDTTNAETYEHFFAAMKKHILS
jgi:hypothetical protein